ncbi:TadE/TadG family type IV pilus assembly protein [Gilliamella mensalis]|uniref:TadE/TadG family type IV pilus assembly protein n=1 Tax=Gilliamella mensalis TaxID=1908520 RepID=UPI000A148F81|nr:TadE/TadG family type IV pilus assembly protein [Gilliamella mensalis]
MLKCWKLFFRKNNANISIEFAIVFPFLILLFLFILELSRIMVIGAALDLMSSQLTRRAAISKDGNYYVENLQKLVNSEVRLWPYLTNPDDFHVTAVYCRTVHDAINETCEHTLSADSHLILFNLKYDYYAVLSEPFSRFLDISLTKKIIVYREFYNDEDEKGKGIE